MLVPKRVSVSESRLSKAPGHLPHQSEVYYRFNTMACGLFKSIIRLLGGVCFEKEDHRHALSGDIRALLYLYNTLR